MRHEKEMLQFFSALIENEIGIVYSEESYFQLINRLETIQKLFGYEDLNAFYREARLGLPKNTLSCLLDLATNNETSFFRDRKVFQVIKSRLIPELLSAGNSLNFWSVASSSGQEAYTLSMIMEELLASTKSSNDYRIHGTDISGEILEKAKSGIYSQLEVQRGLPTPFLIKYFKQLVNDNKWQISPELRRRVQFQQLNLIDNFYLPTRYDMVLCRNVLIYQNTQRKKEILKRVDRFLKPGGYLILGSGETLLGLKDDYNQSIEHGAVVYQKPEAKISLPQSA